MSYLSNELLKVELGSCGDNVKIDDTVKLINPENIYIGNNVRIDAFTIISGTHKIIIKDNVHISNFCSLSASGSEILIEDFCGLSSRVNIFTSTDDYSDGYLTNPTVSDEFKKVRVGKVELRKHSIIGCGSIIMPDVILNFGASIGALSFINKNIPECTIVFGNPPKIIGKRNKQRLIELEERFKNEKL